MTHNESRQLRDNIQDGGRVSTMQHGEEGLAGDQRTNRSSGAKKWRPLKDRRLTVSHCFWTGAEIILESETI